jgi:anthranilate/para-aminobenzoate synthase component I
VTKYRVLRKALPVVVTTTGSVSGTSTATTTTALETWEAVAEVEASSHEGAIRKIVEELGSGGTFVAVPSRSFKETSVAVAQKLAVTLS